jgi:bifunctional non-homologous end joining protein LigD
MARSTRTPESGTRRDTSIRTYRARRDFAVTREPPQAAAPQAHPAPIFVVQKHQAHRAGLHWDFRLEHGGVLWSWAVRKGPSLDPADKRIAVHVEDHPLDYAGFQGEIPAGQYGAGSVETWDRGTWEPIGDPEEGMRKGDLKFILHGTRLHGAWVLVRLRPRPNERSRQENWLLIKKHDDQARAGADAAAIEQATPLPPARPAGDATEPPAAGAKRGGLPGTQSPQLCAIADDPPDGADWISEIKFDGYRLLAWLDHGTVKLVTRNGHDWTDRLPAVAREVAKLRVDTALLDGELVALTQDGRSSFPALQAALSEGRDAALHYYLFDLLHLNGWDLRPCALVERKRVLSGLAGWTGMLRYSDHQAGDTARMRQEACRMKLEGIICKRADAPYRAGRGHGWLKVKCAGREELIVLGWTPPSGRRAGLGSLHLGYYDADHRLHYAGGVGTGFSDAELAALSARLAALASDQPRELVAAGDPLDRSIRWVRPELVVEVQFTAWSGAGRIRHAVYLGLRDDKAADDVVRDVADPGAGHTTVTARPPAGGGPAARRGPVAAIPPLRREMHSMHEQAGSRIVTARKPKPRTISIEGVTLSHPDRELWPGITKQHLAEYWQAVAEHALPGLARRPLAIVRCPEGISGEHFFQKRGHGSLPGGIREGSADNSPYLAIDGLPGLIAMAQIAAIELHVWGASEADPLHPDIVVFDLDPGEGVPFAEVVRAAVDVRDRLRQLGLTSFCRTTGGKGLHVVVPIQPSLGWDGVKPFCRAFAEMLSAEQPERFLPTLKKADRRGRILLDWLRNGLGATAVASFCPRARSGATVATPLSWDEVTKKLDPQTFTMRSVPERLAALRSDPWQGFYEIAQRIPELAMQQTPDRRGSGTRAGRATIVTAAKPRRRAQV